MRALPLLLVCLGLGASAPARADMPASAFKEEENPSPEGVGPGITEPPLGDPPPKVEVDARTEALSSGLRCPVCQGLSVAASPSPAARAMRERVRDLVTAGYTDDQITQYFVDRYGTWVLLAPPAEGVTWLLWLGPGAAVILGLGLIAARASRRKAAPSPPAAPVAAGSDPYRDRILAELDATPEGKKP